MCQKHRLYFSTRVPVQSLITANQRRTLTSILSSRYMWKISAHLPWMGFEPTTFWSTISLTIRIPPLIAHFKVLNFRKWNQSGFSNPLKIISSYQHFQIPHVYTTCLACNATIQQLLSWKSMRKSCSHVFCKQRVMIALMILALHKFIVKNIRSLYSENHWQIIL